MFLFGLFTSNNARSRNMRPLRIREATPDRGYGGASTGSGVRVGVRVTVEVRIMVRFRSEVCVLSMCDFEVAQRISQIAQTDKSRATVSPFSYPVANRETCLPMAEMI